MAEPLAPVPMVLHCPECRTRHVDEGEFATKIHHTHSCQGCGLTWRPAVVPTVGVQFLPGFQSKPTSSMRLVIVESPYAAPTPEGIEHHLSYARAAMADCLARGEAPYASHLLYTQPGVLDDKRPTERKQGIEAGLAWGARADATVVYTDLGVTDGMLQGIERAKAAGREIEYRTLSFAQVDGRTAAR